MVLFWLAIASGFVMSSSMQHLYMNTKALPGKNDPCSLPLATDRWEDGWGQQPKQLRGRASSSQDWVLFYFTIIESLMLHVFASVCTMELTRQMSLISKKRKLTMRLREGWLVNYAGTIRYQCGNVWLWPSVASSLSDQVGLKADRTHSVEPSWEETDATDRVMYDCKEMSWDSTVFRC